jgi:hypothetical protein
LQLQFQWLQFQWLQFQWLQFQWSQLLLFLLEPWIDWNLREIHHAVYLKYFLKVKLKKDGKMNLPRIPNLIKKRN